MDILVQNYVEGNQVILFILKDSTIDLIIRQFFFLTTFSPPKKHKIKIFVKNNADPSDSARINTLFEKKLKGKSALKRFDGSICTSFTRIKLVQYCKKI
jgi:hypothetical protein